MLEGEKSHQPQVDRQRGHDRTLPGVVQPRRCDEPADEPDGVQERNEGQGVRRAAVRQDQNAMQH